METILHRIQQIATNEGIKITAFEKSIGASKGVLSRAITNGTDIQSKVLAFAFGLAAEIERNLISQRTREALNRIKQNGTRFGRPKGARNVKHVMDGKEDDVIELVRKGISLTKIAKIVGVSTATVQKFMKKRDLKTI